MARRVLLFGGTFDPVHHGHLITARSVAEQGGYEKVTLVPAAQGPHKAAAAASAQQRLDMLKLAVEGDDGFDICRDELLRAGPSYTLDTLEAIRRRLGSDVELHWVVGADMLAELPTWHRVGEVMSLATIIVAARPPWDSRMADILDGLSSSLGSDSVEQLRRAVVRTPLIDISSTRIRERWAGGLSIRFLVPPAVGRYIATHGLYCGDRHRIKNK